MIRCIVFDFDGTLVQSNGIKRQAYFQAAAKLGPVEDLVDKVLHQCSGDRFEVLSAIVAAAEVQGRLPEDAIAWIDVLVEEYSRIVEDGVSTCPEVPGASQALSRLQNAGFPLFINSATPKTPLTVALHRRGMDGWFRGVYGGDGGKQGNLKRAMEETGATAAETLYVGDFEVDRAAAEELGCPFVGVLNEYTDFRVGPRYVIKELHGLPALVESMI